MLLQPLADAFEVKLSKSQPPQQQAADSAECLLLPLQTHHSLTSDDNQWHLHGQQDTGAAEVQIFSKQASEVPHILAHMQENQYV